MMQVLPLQQMRHLGVGQIDDGASYGYVAAEGVWEISVASAPFCYEPKLF